MLNNGADITTLEVLLGHKRLNTTMTYAHVHDQTVANEFYRAMEEIEGPQFEAEPDTQPAIDTAKVKTLLDQMAASDLTTEQPQMLNELRDCLAENPSYPFLDN